jgi:hypothetical protein
LGRIVVGRSAISFRASPSANPGGVNEREGPMTTVARLLDAIQARLRRGDSFARVEEEVIERSGLDDRHKSALWLYAWSFVSAQEQRREALAFLMAAVAREAGAGGGRWN